jgi:hypothetical protein
VGDLLRNLILIGGIGFLLFRLITKRNVIGPKKAQLPSENLPPEKFCVECGGKIMRQAEICPLCGCRVA